MKSVRLASGWLLLASAAFAQAAKDPVSTIRAEYQKIEQRLSQMTRVSADMDSLGLEQRSVDGGKLTAYCDDGTLRVLVLDLYGETGDATFRYYFARDSLFFVFVESRRGHPGTGNPYPARTIIERERFYFGGDQLIRWLEPNGRARNVQSAEARKQRKELLADASQYSKKMTNCKPRYAPP